jgi:hypothetical protein
VKHTINHVFLKTYYTNKVKASLYAVLENAKNYTPKGEDADDWQGGMFEDFYEYRKIVDSVRIQRGGRWRYRKT